MYLSAVLKLDQQLANGDPSLAHYGRVLQKLLQAFEHGGLLIEDLRMLVHSLLHEQGACLYKSKDSHLRGSR
jgi:hypothetical protein